METIAKTTRCFSELEILENTTQAAYVKVLLLATSGGVDMKQEGRNLKIQLNRYS